MSQMYLEILEAKDPNTPSYRLSELTYTRNEEAHRLVAQNPNTSSYTLMGLLQKFPAEVSQNPAFSLYLLETPDAIQRLSPESALALAKHEESPEPLLGLLLVQPKRGVSVAIARRPELSAAFLTKMATNSIEVSWLLEHPSMTEEVWLCLCRPKPAKSPYASRNIEQLFLARTRALPAVARAELAKLQDPQVLEALQWRDELSALQPAPLRFGGASDAGLVRDINEDTFVAHHGGSLSLFAVIDGMGGQKTGRVAALRVREILIEEATRTEKIAYNAQDFLHQSFLAAHDAVIETGYSMGATVAALLLRGEVAFIAHLGDSRAYLFREGQLMQLTEDHSLLNGFINAGQLLTQQERDDFPYKNIITRYLGMERTLSTPNIRRLQTMPGDIFMLCTDGIHEMLTEQQLTDELQREVVIDERVQRLITLSNEAGGTDNMAVVLVQIGGTK